MEIEKDGDTVLPCNDKLGFDTKKSAKAAATATRWRYGTILKTYKCHHCDLWHLSTHFTHLT